MKSPNALVMMLDQLLSEVDSLETEQNYISEMRQHINGMCILTLLNFKSKGKKAIPVLERSK